MAPIVKTYGRKSSIRKIEKEDTFDRLLRSHTSNLSNIFESSSDNESNKKKSIESFTSPSTSVKSKDHFMNCRSLKKSWLEISDLSVPDFSDYSETRQKKKKKTNYSNRIRKKKKNNTLEKSTLVYLKTSLISNRVVSSTPKVDSEVASLVNIHPYKHNSIPTVSPIITEISTQPSVDSSPKGVRSINFAPKNILGASSNVLKEQSYGENFFGFPSLDDAVNTSQEFFYGFPSFTENIISEKLNMLQIANETGKLKEDCKTINEQGEKKLDKNNLNDTTANETGILYSTLPVLCDKGTSLDLLVVNINQSKEKSTDRKSVV